MQPATAKEPTSYRTGSKRRLRLCFALLTCFLTWAGMTLWNQSGMLEAKAEQLAEVESRLQETKALNERYKLEVTRLNDSEYIEQKIRKDYYYIRSGETMFYTPKSER